MGFLVGRDGGEVGVGGGFHVEGGAVGAAEGLGTTGMTVARRLRIGSQRGNQQECEN